MHQRMSTGMVCMPTLAGMVMLQLLTGREARHVVVHVEEAREQEDTFYQVGLSSTAPVTHCDKSIMIEMASCVYSCCQHCYFAQHDINAMQLTCMILQAAGKPLKHSLCSC
jgi:hypothetical protein